MLRFFDDHRLRACESLNGTWKFQADPQDCGEKEQWFLGLPQAEDVMVPSVWNTDLDLLEYEGAAWYEKKFFSLGGCLRFCFEGVMTLADIWLDGVHLGSHYGGFCQFELIAEDVAAGEHCLVIRADNRFDETSIPQAKVDWYHYGGITRSVSVERLSGICILHNRLEYTLSPDRASAQCRFILSLYNADAGKKTDQIRANLDGKTVYAASVTLDGRKAAEITTPDFTVADIRLWSPDAPELYEIQCETSTDDLMDRTGFRTVEIVNQRVHINGKAVELRGVNRHEEHPDWGFAFPPALMKRDLDIAQKMGCNTLRGSHYPNSRIFVDMMDARGLLFWSEIPIWGNGFSEEALANPVVVERGLRMHQEMIHYYYNHPCIILWGMHNEIDASLQASLDMTKKYYAYLKENGGNRLVTYATDRPMKDICLKYCDLICINRYTGWYYDKREDWPAFMEDFRALRKQQGLEEKPVVFSEFGAAAVYGHHTFDDLKWTEEYQANMLSECLMAFHRDPMVAGFYIWQFCDMRTSKEMGLNRARSFNNKGLLNEYRRPKMAYFAARQAYLAFAAEEK